MVVFGYEWFFLVRPCGATRWRYLCGLTDKTLARCEEGEWGHDKAYIARWYGLMWHSLTTGVGVSLGCNRSRL